MSCHLKHIPDHLHSKEKPTVHTFDVGNMLYRRCSKDELENPFATISIVDISVNRAELETLKISEEKDVLFNILSAAPEVIEKEVCVLKIKDLLENNTYNKSFEQEKDGYIRKAHLKLMHVPEPCMYPHCAFQLYLDDEEIKSYKAYDKTIGKLRKIKTGLRHELASMIIQREVSQSKRPN